MPDFPDRTVAAKVELELARLEALQVLPAAAARLLSALFEMRLSPSDLTAILETEPALAAMVFSLAHKANARLPQQNPSVQLAAEAVPLRILRDMFLSLAVYQPAQSDAQQIELRKQLVKRAIAVACCAAEIAELSPAGLDPRTAYAAGLLHSIGNLALQQLMPRSFARLVEQARSEKLSLCDAQQRALGLDYTILGKRLAAKWHLPERIALAIWLHQTDTGRLIATVPEARIAHLVRLAYVLAANLDIGSSGSYDSPAASASARSGLELLDLTDDQLESILENVHQKAVQRVAYLDGDSQTDMAAYCQALQHGADQLAAEATKLSEQIQHAQAKSSHFDFASELLAGITAEDEPLEIARRLVCHWKKFYQTGAVCVFLIHRLLPGCIEAAIIDHGNKTSTACLSATDDVSVVPERIQKKFAVVEVGDNCGWLFDQIDVVFDKSCAKIAPLSSAARLIGAIVFEFRYPIASDRLQEMFKDICSFAAWVIDQAQHGNYQRRLAENLSQMLRTAPPSKPVAPAQPTARLEVVERAGHIDALAEMVAGAAHELNNPLSIISGRAQLLARTETDPDKNNTLRQIQDNAAAIAAVVNDLMSFAKPPEPRKTQLGLRQVLDEAVQLTAQKTGLDHIDVQIELPEDNPSIYVDSGQIVSSLANILTNAVESYQGQPGPIRLTAEQQAQTVKLQICDFGCGMDTETLAKAAYPFFSAKAAGRKRGMGLAYAARLIELNAGSIHIRSSTGAGTTITVTLPCE